MIFHVLKRVNARDRIFVGGADDATIEFHAHGQVHNLTTGSGEYTEP